MAGGDGGGELIAPVGAELAPSQPSQRFIVVDERHEGRADGLQRAGPGAHPAGSEAGLRWPPMQDPNYKRLFSFPRMVEGLLRAFLPGDVFAELDFSTLAKLPGRMPRG